MNDRVFVAKMIAYMEEHLSEALSTDEMAVYAGYSANRFRQKFYSVTGETPIGYLRKRRLTEAAKAILRDEKLSEIAQIYGYSSQDNFATAFKSYFGVTPGELAKIDGKYRRFIRKMREAYSIMELADLKQPPLNATLMGCIRGASDFFEYDYSTPFLYGATGHAFLINIHTEICPSSPYAWKHEPFDALLPNIGMRHYNRYVVTRDTPAETRADIEAKLRNHVDEGELCMLTFLEHQLVSGYDDDGFVMTRPWDGRGGSEVGRISAGTWEECLAREGWAIMSVLAATETGTGVMEKVKGGLEFALRMFDSPEEVQRDGYRAGFGAYEVWIDAVRRGLGAADGSWWCGTVWSESRSMASAFFSEVSDLAESPSVAARCAALASQYAEMARLLSEAKEKELDQDVKIGLLQDALRLEHEAEARIRELAGAL